MYNESKYNKVKDIFSVPSAVRMNGEKAIRICGKFAYVQYLDGMKTYYKRDKFSMWECIRTEVRTNF